MSKTSTNIIYKSDESYLKAEWLPEGDLVPMFMDTVRIYPRVIVGQGGANSKAFFYVYASDNYEIMSSHDAPELTGFGTLLREDTLSFLEETSKELTDLPHDGSFKAKWYGIPSQPDLEISLSGKRIRLNQKATGSLLVQYEIEVKIYSIPLYEIDGIMISKITDIRIFGFFLNDLSKSTSLTLFPTQEIEDPNRLPDDIDKWEPWVDDEGKDYTAANQRHGWNLDLVSTNDDITSLYFKPWESIDESVSGMSAKIEDGVCILKSTAGSDELEDIYLYLDNYAPGIYTMKYSASGDVYIFQGFGVDQDKRVIKLSGINVEEEFTIEEGGYLQFETSNVEGNASLEIEWIDFEPLPVEE